ncbi:MAG: UDP-galactopyranose mutase [Bacteroidota bacterium]|nr:UDP-galactopyranose mutase [Bacteroidota bacterium]
MNKLNIQERGTVPNNDLLGKSSNGSILKNSKFDNCKPINGYTNNRDKKTSTLNKEIGNKPEIQDFVCLSHLRWNFVFQRPQHIMTRVAKHYRVYFIEEPIFDSPEKDYYEINAVEEGVNVVVPHLRNLPNEEEVHAALRNLVNDLMAGKAIQNFLLWYLTPMALSFTDHLRPLMTIYDCMDELSHFKGAPVNLLQNEERLFKMADLVFTGGQSLYEYKKNKHANIHPFPSSIDKEHFSSGLFKTDPEDQKDIPHPRLGFFGVIDERLDIELLDGVAEACPDWNIVMIGPTVKIDPSTLPRKANIYYLGPKDYKVLPQYLAHWDVAMLPFARNESTRFISPTKTPEYLCAAKPVISTSIMDVIRPYGENGLVHIADNVKTFKDALSKALVQKNNKKWLQKVEDFLVTNSWDSTWSRMRTIINTTLEDKASSIMISIENTAKEDAKVGGTLMYDYLIVGAGFAGSVLAERLARESNKKVLLIDKRNHVAGNAYDHFDDHGILVHKYGPHIFHTNSKDVFEYLGKFTKWRDYQHRVLASVDGMMVPMPINLDTINKLYGFSFNSTELEDFFASVAENVKNITTSEDVVISKVGRELYEKFFKGYTRKQWGLDPSELNASVTARVPTRTNRDDRYFTDTYQAMPLHGYTRMFQNMLLHPNINIMLNTDYKDIMNLIPYKEIIYTGPIDEYFNFRFGKLPYRSLEFVHETHDKEVFQNTGTINYPNDHLYTRITEFKYLTGQQHKKTSIVYEYPKAEGDPYYPVPQKENYDLYKRYEKLAEEIDPDVHFVGRLATYKYYNMDQVVAQALAVFKKIQAKQLLRSEKSIHYASH